jgi:hypothetical protein
MRLNVLYALGLNVMKTPDRHTDPTVPNKQRRPISSIEAGMLAACAVVLTIIGFESMGLQIDTSFFELVAGL